MLPAIPMTDTPFTPYQRRLFAFLSVATFFEGYDFFAVTQVLPHLAREHGLDESQKGLVLSVVGIGTMLSYFVVRLADVLGRRRVLTITIVGYTLATLVTAVSQGIVMFTLAQVVARAFLIGEWAISMVIAAEEFPAERRGFVIGLIQGASSLGYIVCSAVVPLLVQTGLGWRTVYFVGVVPLLFMAVARRDLRETARFEAASAPVKPSIFRIFGTKHRGKLLILSAIWFLALIAPHNAVSFWKIFVGQERGFTEKQIGGSIAIAAVAALPLVFATGKLIDRVGRKWGATIVFAVSIVGTSTAYMLHGRVPLTVALIAGIFGASGYLPILNAYTAELFPTELRGDAFAWAATFLGRISYVISPFLVGAAVDRVGHYEDVMPWLSVFTFLAWLGIVLLLPETTGKDLEETSQ
jgi:putative MFS transporter